VKLAIMQPYFAPYLGYFQLMAAVDRFVLLDDVNFINRGWINRNRILVGGREHMITIPLRGASQNLRINEIELDDQAPWRAKLARTLEQAYRKAPYFEETMPLLRAQLACPDSGLAPFLRASLASFHAWLELPCRLVDSAAAYGNESLKGAERIMDICRREGAAVYINPPGGRELYDAAAFAAQGTELRFLKPRLLPYPQGTAEFLPGLSIIDILMHQGRAATRAALTPTEFA
jgi:hypothetical protein